MTLYPFFVLDLPEVTTDAAVQARYDALVRQNPPDRAPARFELLREAYEAIRTEEQRLQVALFFVDDNPHALRAALPIWLRRRARLSPKALGAMLAATTQGAGQ